VEESDNNFPKEFPGIRKSAKRECPEKRGEPRGFLFRVLGTAEGEGVAHNP